MLSSDEGYSGRFSASHVLLEFGALRGLFIQTHEAGTVQIQVGAVPWQRAHFSKYPELWCVSLMS